jgi:SAM-dependent methyltransferase
MIEHFYKDIQGHFDFEGPYADAVSRAKDGGVLVEVGTWRGCSLAFLAVQAHNSGKQLQVIGVDMFEDSADTHMANNPENGQFPTLAEVSAHFIQLPQVRLIKALSWVAAGQFARESVDFIWLDACHDYASVKRDIDAWWPVLKPGGVFGGHDYDLWNYPGVVAAVHEKFGPCRRIHRSWIVEKPC